MCCLKITVLMLASAVIGIAIYVLIQIGVEEAEVEGSRAFSVVKGVFKYEFEKLHGSN
jgi:hypothetical protein